MSRNMINLSVLTTAESIAGGIEAADALELIMAIDLAQQDAEFTEELIVKLFQSLFSDLDHADIKVILKRVKTLSLEHR